MRSRIKISVATAVTTAMPLLLAGEAAAQGCAMCKTAVGDPLAEGFNASILFMMAMPFGLAAAVGGWIGYMVLSSRPGWPENSFFHTKREGSR
jgi:hypothetical protein